MKAKIKPISAEERDATWQRAFGHMPVKEHTSEWYIHKEVAKHLREHYPNVRFYTSLDGFDLGKQRSLIAALQWFEAGFPDLLIFMPARGFSMLVLELKREGVNIYNKRKELASEHLERQSNWLRYFQHAMNARAEFAVGKEQAIQTIDNYLKPTKYGKAKK
jgi:hypothetical protein